MRVYLAGRIAKNDWRHRLVDKLHRMIVGPAVWRGVNGLKMLGHTYVGPFFVACDHGCAHGPHTHGTMEGITGGCASDSAGMILPREVLDKSFSGIGRCDLFVAYADAEFREAFGTLTEIGYARARRKPIVLIQHPGLVVADLWFAQQCADAVIVSADPVASITSLLNANQTTRALREWLRGARCRLCGVAPLPGRVVCQTCMELAKPDAHERLNHLHCHCGEPPWWDWGLCEYHCWKERTEEYLKYATEWSQWREGPRPKYGNNLGNPHTRELHQ